jgi:hypothetical protein
MDVWTGERVERHAFHAVLSNVHKRPETIRLWSRFVFVLDGRFRLFALILSVSPQKLCGFHAIYHLRKPLHKPIVVHRFCKFGSQRLSSHLARNHHQSIREHGLSVRQMLWNCQIVCAFCLFSAQRNEQETNHVAVNLHISSVVNRERRRFLQALDGRFLCFALISHISPHKSSNLRAIYHLPVFSYPARTSSTLPFLTARVTLGLIPKITQRHERERDISRSCGLLT